MKKRSNLLTHLTRFYRKKTYPQLPGLPLTFLIAFIFLGAAFPGSAQTFIPNPQEFVGPFPSWVNVKTKYGAKGDGVTDDSQALQRAFNELGTTSVNGSKVLYLPAGTYRIATGLTMAAKLYISVIGEDPATTRIKWDGVTGGTMFFINGVAYSRFSRITWDGSKRAKTAIAHKWDNQTGYAVTHNEHSDEVFVDVEHGLRGGTGGSMDAETAVLRCRFIRNTIAGVSIESWNALDWYVWDCYFEDCRVGVTNNPPSGGAGNFHVYHSIFKRSTSADISMLQTMYFSVRDNYSIGSKAFFQGGMAWQNGGPITLQNNTILDPTSQTPISFGSKGPITLLDNVIRSSEGQTGPVVFSEGDITTVGNVYTISNTVSAKEKRITVDDVVKSRSMVNPSEPALLGIPQKRNRRVFELTLGSSDEKFQKTIDSAAALTGQRPVIHLRPGTYYLSKTVVIPAGSDMQIIGDGFGTVLKWGGVAGGELMRLDGADRVVLEGFTINGNADPARAIGLTIKHSDQADKRIFMEGVTVTYNNEAGVLMEGFKYATAELHDFNHSVTGNVGVKVVGAGAGTTLPGGLSIFGGSSSANRYSYDVQNGGNLKAEDIWYEGQPKGFVNLTGSGNFTLNGARIWANSVPDTPILIDNFSGRATFLGVHMNGKFTVKGDGTNTNALAMGNQFDTQNAYSNISANAKTAMLNSRVYNAGSYPLANVGSADPVFIRKMLEQVRTVRPRYKTGATGLVMHRVQVTLSVIGIRIQTGTALAVQNQPPAVSVTSPVNNASVTAPASVAIAANASDADGRVAKVEFYNGTTKLGEDIDGSNGWNYAWSNVAAGNYTITAKAIDDDGAATTSGAVALTVLATTVANQVPTVNAGTDRTITLPTSSVTLTGTATDNDGRITGYAWTKQSGPAATLSGTTTASLTAGGLVAGSYLFRLTVTDDKGATKSDDVAVTVNAAPVSAPAPAGQSVVSLTLVNADTDRDIATLTEGYVIDFTAIGTKNLSIRANTNPGTVGSVVFRLNGSNVKTENLTPYTLSGDGGSDYYPWVPPLGNHTLTVTPYAASGGGGTVGTALTVRFSVVSSTTAPVTNGQSVVSFTLVNADTDRDIATLTEGYVIDFAAIGTSNLSVRANTNPGIVGSVAFRLNGTVIQTENGAPYAIKGNGGADYRAWVPATGGHSLTAVPYTAVDATGTSGTSLTVNFSVVNGTAGTRLAAESPTTFSFSSIYPNPAGTTATLVFSSAEGGEMDVVVSNLMGLEVSRTRITVLPGENSVQIPVSNLQVGSYYVRIGDYQIVERLMVGR